MVDIKTVPNLDDVKHEEAFIAIYEGNTKAELTAQLDQSGIGYNTNDSKSSLAWRLMDANDTHTDIEKKADTNSPSKPKDHAKSNNTLKVENAGAYSFIEPHTSTLIKAKTTTVICLSEQHDKDKVLRNIAQLNISRSNVLTVL